MDNIVRFFLNCLLLVFRGEEVLKICWFGQKFRWKKKQMGNLVVDRENAAKFALFWRKRSLLLVRRVVIHIR